MAVWNRLKEKIRGNTKLSKLLWSIRGLWGDTPEIVSARYYIPRTRHIIDSYLDSQTSPKLHIGAQAHILDGWLNVDIYPGASNKVAYLDATKKFPLYDNSFDYIFSEHMIEHITHAQANYMLSECFRILRPGGKIRIATPDINKLLALDTSKGLGKAYFEQLVRPVYETKRISMRSDIGYLLNYIMHNYGHQFVYTEETLVQLMKGNGFFLSGTFSPGESNDKVFKDIEGHFKTGNPLCDLETMNIEAYKSLQ